MNWGGRVWLALVLALATSWLGQTEARAQSNVAQAKELFQEGTAAVQTAEKLLRGGDKDEALASYGVAAEKFLAAYRSAPNVLVLYNLGEVYWARDERSWALACYQSFLKEAADDTRERVQSAVPAVRERVVQQLGNQPEPTPSEDPIDPVGVCYQGAEPTAGPTAGEPGDDDPTEGAGEFMEIPPPAEKRGGKGYRVAFWASSAVTVGALTGAIISFSKVRSLEEDKEAAIRDFQASSGMALDQGDACADAKAKGVQSVSDICDDGKSQAATSNILQGVALVGALASGFFLYKGYLQKPSSGERAGVSVSPVLSPESVGASVMLRF